MVDWKNTNVIDVPSTSSCFVFLHVFNCSTQACVGGGEIGPTQVWPKFKPCIYCWSNISVNFENCWQYLGEIWWKFQKKMTIERRNNWFIRQFCQKFHEDWQFKRNNWNENMTHSFSENQVLKGVIHLPEG